MKKIFLVMAAICCAMAVSATTYTSHLKVVINGEATEQDEVQVDVTQVNGLYNLSLKNFCLTIEGVTLAVGNIVVNNVEGVDAYGYTTLSYQAPVTITPGDDGVHSESDWIGPILGEVPLDMTARFTATALNANIDIQLEVLGQTISVTLFGVAPELKGDVNKDGEVTVADVNSVITEILSK